MMEIGKIVARKFEIVEHRRDENKEEKCFIFASM
jgi:hypothetical protein